MIKKLSAADNLELRNTHFCKTGVDICEGVSVIPFVRLNFILSGRKPVTLPINGKAEYMNLKTGDVQISCKNSWEKPTWDTPHEILCIVPRTQYLRISYYKVYYSKRNKKKERLIKNLFYHTDKPCSDCFNLVVDALFKTSELSDNAACKHILHSIICLAQEEAKKPPEKTISQSDHTYRRILATLENNYYEDITRDSIASSFNLNPGYISQLFTAKSGQSFNATLTGIRIKHACELLLHTNLTVYQAGYQCGFPNAVHFVRKFREIIGLSPGRYRRQQKKRHGKR